jgi:hypothetical protein
MQPTYLGLQLSVKSICESNLVCDKYNKTQRLQTTSE